MKSRLPSALSLCFFADLCARFSESYRHYSCLCWQHRPPVCVTESESESKDTESPENSWGLSVFPPKPLLLAPDCSQNTLTQPTNSSPCENTSFQTDVSGFHRSSSLSQETTSSSLGLPANAYILVCPSQEWDESCSQIKSPFYICSPDILWSLHLSQPEVLPVLL